ncbi:hypothetical protein V5E97_01385 [Singulisphaera sp. Ch08]|uniref:DNRLRE domain-containing protein n=1 Tax=Singulisphaera sp. Ch08 TaxID=3120278 RepID=A0AAU7CHH8_9BACT
MHAAFQGLSWLQRWKGTPDLRSERTRLRRNQTRFRVESLEPRWLLSTTGTSLAEVETPKEEFSVPVDYGSAMPILATNASLSLVDDWSTAHQVPFARIVTVHGSLSPGSAPDLLEIYSESGVSYFDFVLKSAWANQPIAEGIRVFDANFKEYANYSPNPATSSFTFSIRLRSEKASSLFVKITPPAETEPAYAQGFDYFPYILEVTRNPQSAPQLGGPSTSPADESDPFANCPFLGSLNISPFPLDTSTGPLIPPPEPSSPDPNTQNQPPVVSGPLPYEPGQDEYAGTYSPPVHVGPLPVRSTAPLGGVLAAPETVPPVDRHEAARADLAEFDPARPVDDLDLEVRLPVPVAEPEVVQVVTLRGPGGLPLLATALIASSAAVVTTDSATSADSGQAESVEAASAPGFVSAPIPGNSRSAESSPLQSPPSRTTTEASGRPPSRSRRSSVVPGLTLAFALVVGLVLPDLFASLQFLAPSRPMVRLRLIRRAIRGQ